MALLFLNSGRKYSKINKNIYGHFSEHLGRGIYGGLYVGEDSDIPNVRGLRTDVINALKAIKVPILRWPGGCFAEYYNWRDGIGKKSERKRIVNTSWGGVVESNHFGTHEFMDLCEQIGCEAYIAGNVGSGTPRELSEWVEYLNFEGESPMANLRRENGHEKAWNVKYFGVGNENWACGGNMRAEYYADVYKRFATYMRQYGGTELYKVACGANGADYEWTDCLMRHAADKMDGLSLHYYTMPQFYSTEEYPWEEKGSATNFDEANYYRTLRRALYTEELIKRHKHVMDKYDPAARVDIVFDEWGTWHTAEESTNPAFLFQQNTMRDAIVAGVSLNIFNAHSDRVKIANLAQMVNVLQSPVLTEGGKMLLTPTYYVFELYKAHQNAQLIESYVQQNLAGTDEAPVPAMSVSASEDENGKLHATLVNLAANKKQSVQCRVDGGNYSAAKVRYISGAIDSYNTFDQNPCVQIKNMQDIIIKDNCFSFEMPACCVAEITLD